MKSTLITLAIALFFLASCGSNSNSSSNDSVMTDTSMVDTAAMDATGSIDTAITPPADATLTDTPGSGATPAPQP